MWKQRIKSVRLIAEKFYVSVNFMTLCLLSLTVHAQSVDHTQGRGVGTQPYSSALSVVSVDLNNDKIIQTSTPSFLTSTLIDQLAQCRTLASRKWDGGVDVGQMMGDEALAACEPVAPILALQPEVQYLYARSLEAVGREAEALAVYKIASDLGSGKADAALGRVYLESNIEAREALVLATASFEQGYERGDPIATFRLYELFKAERPSVASELLAYARHHDYVPAILESARLLMIAPENTTLSEPEAEALLLKAANAGDTRSMGYLGRKWVLLPENDERRQRAVSFLRQAAANMDQEAASTLGLLMLTGDVEQRAQDNPRAMLEQAVENSGTPRIKAALATIIIKEDGINADAARVVSLLSEAAAAGDSGSASNLGTFYRTGLFVEQDMSLAARWYLIGLALGSEEFSEQIYGYVPWDARGRDGLVYALKNYLASLGLLESSVDDIPDSTLARAVSRYMTEIDAVIEGGKLL